LDRFNLQGANGFQKGGDFRGGGQREFIHQQDRLQVAHT
jgi:hypothetical protein